MSRHQRNKPGEGPRQYKERKLYFATCATHGTRYQSFYQRNIRIEACGKCRREASKVSPGQIDLLELSVTSEAASGQERVLTGAMKGQAVDIGYIKKEKTKGRPS